MSVPAPGLAAPVAAAVEITMEKLLEKEREVKERAAEIARREREVRLALQRMQPNWPFKFLCINPVVYHDIVSEIPTERVSFVKWCYGNYFATILFILFNIVCALAAMTTSNVDFSGGGSPPNYGAHLGASFLYVIGIPLAFIVWYFPIYKAAGTGQRGKYNLAFLGTTIAFLYNLFMALGFVGYGGCGWLFALSCRNNKSGSTAFIMSAICALMWSVQAAFFLGVIMRLRGYSVQDQINGLTGRAAPSAGPQI